ncbi:hypothetical protein CRUP_003887 [Coryphaenoides rupestris]|nr:hypothetical protein CRUP_003887 [Coryphaenoides rupestris]
MNRVTSNGERLDLGSCEALEVVLKSLRFDFINLRAARLEENGASSLLDMILYYESTAHLDLSDNTHHEVPKDSSKAGSVAVWHARTLSALKSNRSLLELHLSNNMLNSYQDAMQLGDLLRYNRTLQTLELSHNAIADAGHAEVEQGAVGHQRLSEGLQPAVPQAVVSHVQHLQAPSSNTISPGDSKGKARYTKQQDGNRKFPRVNHSEQEHN